MHSEPTAYFLTWVTYGAWLPGDARGWVVYRGGWRLPDPVREREAAAVMTENACTLDRGRRLAVEEQIAATCRRRGWILHAVNCRSNHVHAVVTAAGVTPKRVRTDLKAWATRRLKQVDAKRVNWWAERGSVRFVNGEESLAEVVAYVRDVQDRQCAPTRSVSEGRGAAAGGGSTHLDPAAPDRPR
ncbi:transposase [Alienimonas californiensis]|uniref:Transposase IS200 like protein n=1 Tax=Alienimonas californiensis TaxID=2527989 RepID=A0A517P5M8_9PLAN|nr:transposase [Alienimonas californiensis]QDT14665.1 Transposase IS200 like protein [Alienimonas californiensis]